MKKLNIWLNFILTIYAPMISTASCVMFLMRADTLRGQVRVGWALEIERFLGPVKFDQNPMTSRIEKAIILNNSRISSNKIKTS
jgi:hypothetical protein